MSLLSLIHFSIECDNDLYIADTTRTILKLVMHTIGILYRFRIDQY